jgi:hypothetical protein
MGAPAHTMSPIRLKDDEGELRVIVEGLGKPSEQEVNSRSLDKHFVLTHEPCGGMPQLVKVSHSKRVLFCEKCGLRLSLSRQVTTFGDMRKVLSL